METLSLIECSSLGRLVLGSAHPRWGSIPLASTNNRKIRMKVRTIAYRRNYKRRTFQRPVKYWDKYIRHQSRHLKVGTIIETCGCDIARVISIEGDDLLYESLTRGGQGSCSVYNCGPLPLRPVAVQRRLDIFKTGGMKALVRRWWKEDCQMTDEQVAQLETETD